MERNEVNHSTFDIEMSVSYRIRAEIPQKGIEAEACADHIHMLVSIPPHLSVAQFMGYLKGESTLMIFGRHANLKYKYGSRHFWCRGYYVDTVVMNKKGNRGIYPQPARRR